MALIDQHGRTHEYLRISLTERCNLRCTYCMPEEGIELSPKDHIMSVDEIFTIAKSFSDLGIKKIRFTGGEPLVRKEAAEILRRVSTLPVELAITTNAIIVDKFIPLFKEIGLRKINVSLDTFRKDKFEKMTRRDDFVRVWRNIQQLINDDFFNVKINCVLMRGENEDEILDFISLSENNPVSVRFIEFMPFSGNKWEVNQTISFDEIINIAKSKWSDKQLIKLKDDVNDTTRHFQIKGFQGDFGIISTVTNPFCDTCNRIRLTADGKIKNCLFSNGEEDLLTPLRVGEDIQNLIYKNLWDKEKSRGGMDFHKRKFATQWQKNRSMIKIGG